MIAASSFSDSDFKTEDIKAKCIKAFPEHLRLSFLSFLILYSSYKKTKTQNKISAKFNNGGQIYSVWKRVKIKLLKGIWGGSTSGVQRRLLFHPGFTDFPHLRQAWNTQEKNNNNTVRCIWEWKQNKSNKYSGKSKGKPMAAVQPFRRCTNSACSLRSRASRMKDRKNRRGKERKRRRGPPCHSGAMRIS